MLSQYIFCIKYIFIKLDFGKEEPSQTENKEQQPPVTPAPTNNSTSTNNSERPSKRPRRTRHDTFSGLENNHTETVPAEHVLRNQVPTSTSTNSAQKKSSGKSLNFAIQLNTFYDRFYEFCFSHSLYH